MRIHDTSSRLAVNATQAAQKVSQAKGSTVDDTQAASDNVHVSARGRELAMKADHEVDSARVERLRASIEAGEFKIDARRIADRMIQGG